MYKYKMSGTKPRSRKTQGKKAALREKKEGKSSFSRNSAPVKAKYLDLSSSSIKSTENEITEKKRRKEKPATKRLLKYLNQYSKPCCQFIVLLVGLLGTLLLYAFLFGNVTTKEIREVSELIKATETLENVGLIERPNSPLQGFVVATAETLPYLTPSSIAGSVLHRLFGYAPAEVDVSKMDKGTAKRLPANEIEKDYYYNRMKQLQYASSKPTKLKNMLNGNSKGIFSKAYTNQDLAWVLN
mmetsp:Transcript_9369/g.10677  ORF Transcript_9369/g.10677 Transcript_9369/m.10677 type:complete len:242 (-) Transcript_9369:1050-1775(-)